MGRLLRTRPEHRRRATALLVALMLVSSAPGLARAASTEGTGPGNFLTDLTDRAVTQLTEPGIGEVEKKTRFRGLLRQAFDLPAIGRFVLGRYWRRADAVQRRDFLDVFEDMMLQRFLPLFADYSGEKFDIGPTRPYRNDPEFVSVESKLRQVDLAPIRVDWRVRKSTGGYKIVDIVAEGVSIAVSLRSEFASVLKRNGGDVDALTRVLREKIEDL